MTILNLISGMLGGVCTVLGIPTAVEVLPGFIKGSELIGPTGTTTAFFWGLAALLLLGCIAAAVSRSRSSNE